MARSFTLKADGRELGLVDVVNGYVVLGKWLYDHLIEALSKATGVRFEEVDEEEVDEVEVLNRVASTTAVVKLMAWRARAYDVAAAMRGPDAENNALKKVFTARIRYLAAGGKEARMEVMTRKEADVMLDEVAEAIVKLDPHHMHFLNHVVTAVENLEALGLIEPREAEFLARLADLLHDFAMWLWDLESSSAVAQDIALDKLDELVAKLNEHLDEYAEFIVDEEGGEA